MEFTATECGFHEGMGGASNQAGQKDYHYVLFGRQTDKQHPEFNGVYFEFDDKINGKVNYIVRVKIRDGIVDFVRGDAHTISVKRGIPSEQWDGFLVGIRSTFNHEIIQDMADKPIDYQPPENRDDLLRRYENGERSFPEAELTDANLSGTTLDGANFEKFSWFHTTNFEGASLRGTIFRYCNVKCANFKHADLTGASFEGAAIDAAEFEGAILEGASFVGAGSYGYTIKDGDGLPG
jgi:hypothetical protein